MRHAGSAWYPLEDKMGLRGPYRRRNRILKNVYNILHVAFPPTILDPSYLLEDIDDHEHCMRASIILVNGLIGTDFKISRSGSSTCGSTFRI